MTDARQGMSDAQVGELWRNCHESLDEEEFRLLILKLIEERAQLYPSYITAEEQKLPKDELMKLCDQRIQVQHEKACADFGINYAEYLAAREGA